MSTSIVFAGLAVVLEALRAAYFGAIFLPSALPEFG